MNMKGGLPFRILLVDDDQEDREIIDAAFMEIGYGTEVKKFADGQALIKYLEEIDATLYPSLIVLDNTLTGHEAQDILSDLKKNDRYKSIPVIIYTTAVSPTKKSQLLERGAYACIEKGSKMEAIIEVAKTLRNFAEENKRN